MRWSSQATMVENGGGQRQQRSIRRPAMIRYRARATMRQWRTGPWRELLGVGSHDAWLFPSCWRMILKPPTPSTLLVPSRSASLLARLKSCNLCAGNHRTCHLLSASWDFAKPAVVASFATWPWRRSHAACRDRVVGRTVSAPRTRRNYAVRANLHPLYISRDI